MHFNLKQIIECCRCMTKSGKFMKIIFCFQNMIKRKNTTAETCRHCKPISCQLKYLLTSFPDIIISRHKHRLFIFKCMTDVGKFSQDNNNRKYGNRSS